MFLKLIPKGNSSRLLIIKTNYFSFLSTIVLAAGFSTANAQLLETNDVSSTSKFESAETCRTCHETQYNQWRSSIMGYSSISPPIHALELTENHVFRDPFSTGQGFGRLAKTQEFLPGTSMPNPRFAPGKENQLFCQKCHAPVAVFTNLFKEPEELFTASQGSIGHTETFYTDDNRHLGAIKDSHEQLQDILAAATPGSLEERNARTAMEGVTCTVCHRINGQSTISTPAGTPPRPEFEVGVANSAYLIHHYLDSETPANFGPFFLPGETGDAEQELTVSPPSVHDTAATQPMLIGEDGVTRPYIKTGEFCGSCHDVRIPVPDAIATNPDGSQQAFRRVENLFSEWRNSPWNNNDNIPNQDGVPDSVVRGGVFASSLDNPREAVAGGSIKQITTCQDCHMSKFMTHIDAEPGEYERGLIASSGSSTDRQITNHRFIGVDRFLVPLTDDPSDFDFDVSKIALSNTGLNEEYEDFDVNSLTFDPTSTNPATNFADGREIILKKAVDFKIVTAELENRSNNKTILPVKVSATNVGVGHNIPAGLSQERQVWIELEVLDKDDQHIYTSGYLNAPATLNDTCDQVIPVDPAHPLFDPTGPIRYKDSFCGEDDGKHEYECNLDSFVARLDTALRVTTSSISGNRCLIDGRDVDQRKTTGEQLGLVNYQNGFTRNGQKVLTQFIGDAIDNNNSLKPFEERIHQYDVDVSGREGPFKVNARLRFRPFPAEFLEVLANTRDHDGVNGPDLPSSRVDHDVIEGNIVIEMENDRCVTGTVPLLDSNDQLVRACSPTVPLALGKNETCAVTKTGIARCWGTGNSGVLGDGNTSSHKIGKPRQVNKISGVKMVAVSDNQHVCAVMQDGTANCWGNGNFGQLGDNDKSNHKVGNPRKVVGLNNATMISLGYDHSCALLDDETVSCWGKGNSGQLGDGNTNNHEVKAPKPVPGLSNVKMIALGGDRSCALTATNEANSSQVKCWGSGSFGQLGNGSNNNDQGSPVTVQGLDYKVTMIAAGENHTCALLATGNVKCWGAGGDGQLGNSGTSDRGVAVDVVGIDKKAIMIAAGGNHSCALLDDKSVKCWGDNFYGQLGNGSTIDTATPAFVASLPNVNTIALGNAHSCAELEDDRSIQCWGDGSFGQLGDGNTSNHFEAAPIPVAIPIVANGDFSYGKTSWNFQLSGGDGAFKVNNKDQAFVRVDGTSSSFATVQLKQNGLSLEKDKSYLVQFDAKANKKRDIVVSIAGHFETISLTTSFKTYSFSFAMNDTTTCNAILAFLLGLSNVSVFIDNVLIEEVGPGGIPQPDILSEAELYTQNGNIHNNDFIKVEQSGRVRVGYVKFTVPDPTGSAIVTSAKLRLRVMKDMGQGTVRIFTASHNAWNDNTSNAGALPSAVSELANLSGQFKTGQDYEFDLSSGVILPGTYSFIIRMDSGDNDVWFDATGSTRPTLVTRTLN